MKRRYWILGTGWRIRIPAWPRLCSVRHPASSLQNAFTLIELMIVIGIAGLVMATAVPFVHSSLRKNPLRQAVSDVVEACSAARAKAILSGTPTELRISPVLRTLAVMTLVTNRMSAPERAETYPGEAPAPPPSADSFAAVLSPEVTIEMLDVNYQELKDAEEARVRFFPNSTSDEFTIVLQHEQRDWRKISLELVTALAEVQVLDGRTWK
jgi:prepilin-type N-terminal cleavage/methylation domain-containing protein